LAMWTADGLVKRRVEVLGLLDFVRWLRIGAER